jgi:UDP-N-acetylmuramoyl-tripeptide--D-alanyl-D-alanine ligase
MFEIITLTILTITFLKILDLTYRFQIKEYRYDRFQSQLKEEGLLTVLYSKSVRLPAKKLRNLLIIIFSFIGLGFLHLLLIDQPIKSLIFFLLFSPCFALIITLVAVELTSIPVKLYREWLIYRATHKVAHTKTVFIGITGSYGKTSVKEFLHHILSTKYRVGKTEKNMNSDVGVALSILKNYKLDMDYFVCETGAYKKGEIKKSCEIFKPHIGVLTSIGNQHIDLFGGKTNLVQAKKELLLCTPSEGKVYLNKDIKEFDELKKGVSSQIISYSSTATADIYATDIHIANNMLQATIHLPNLQTFPITLHMLGLHNITNLLPCISIAYDLGMSIGEIQNAIAILKPVLGKLSLEKGINNTTIINDSYNSNVEGFISAINTLNSFPHQSKYIISRGIIELGPEKGSSYKKIFEALKKTNILLYTTDPLFSAYHTDGKVFTFNDEEHLLIDIIPKLNEHAILLIEGRFKKESIKQLIMNNE